jgi:hypothetical protein
MFTEVDISLNIKSNVDYNQTANLMGSNINMLDTANAKTEYRWNLTGFVFTTEAFISVEWKAVGAASFNLFSQPLGSQTLEGCIIDLNQLGIGYFNLYTEAGQTYIGTYNDNYAFGDLTIYPSAVAPTTTTTTTAAPPTTTTTTTSAPTTTTTTTLATFTCGVTDTGFTGADLWDLGVTSGAVNIVASALPVGATYDIIYPVGGSIIHTTIPVNGSGNLNDTFYWSYDSVNSLVEFVQTGL